VKHFFFLDRRGNQSRNRLRLEMLPTDDESENALVLFPEFQFPKLNHKMISYACDCTSKNIALDTILNATILVAVAVQLIVVVLSVMMMTQVAIARHICIPLWTQMMMVNMCRICNGWT
jgi:hypothetical protein